MVQEEMTCQQAVSNILIYIYICVSLCGCAYGCRLLYLKALFLAQYLFKSLTFSVAMPSRHSSRRHSHSGHGGVTGLSATGLPGNGPVNNMIPQQQLQQLPQQLLHQQQHGMQVPMMAGMQPVMTSAPANNDEVEATLFSDDDVSLSTDDSRSRSRDRHQRRGNRERRRDGPRRGRNARRRDRRGRSASNDSAEVLAQQTLPSGYIPRNITFLRSVPKVSWTSCGNV